MSSFWNAGPDELSIDKEWTEPDPEDCARCQGTGKIPYRGEGWCWCPDCNGSGIVEEAPEDEAEEE